MVIEPQYENTEEFRGGLAAVCPMDTWKWGYINTKGKYIWEPTE